MAYYYWQSRCCNDYNSSFSPFLAENLKGDSENVSQMLDDDEDSPSKYAKADTVALEKFSNNFAELTESSKEVNAHTVSYFKVNTELKSAQLERERLAVEKERYAVEKERYEMLQSLYVSKNNLKTNGAPDDVLGRIQAQIEKLQKELFPPEQNNTS